MTNNPHDRSAVRIRSLIITLAFILCIPTGAAFAKKKGLSNKGGNSGFCSQTSKAWNKACQADAEDEYWLTNAKCVNISDIVARDDCYRTAKDDRKESLGDCKDGLDWRLSICDQIGEARYDPLIDPADFESDYHNLMNPNPYFPIAVGNHWEYVGGGEVNTVDILDQTKLISGVTCVVSLDQVFNPVNLSESTNDWYCQATDTTVWYFGEETGEYETNPGDNPPLPELVNIDGAFKQGRDGAKGGIIFEADPVVGDIYVEESSIGEAEDETEILSTTYSYGNDPALDELVPQSLADLLCGNGDCIVTKNLSLLEPDLFERKYYAPGIGVFLEVDPDAGTISQLVDCNFDARCSQLPQP